MAPLAVRTVPLDDDHPLVDLVPAAAGATPGRPGAVAWIRGGEGFVGWGEAARVDAGAGDERFARAAAWFADLVATADVDDPVDLPGSGLVGVGSFTFDPRSHGSVLVVPAVVVGRRDGRTWVTVAGRGDLPTARLAEVAPLPPAQRVRYAGSSMPDVHWLEAVTAAVERIRGGDLDKVVLARDHAVWAREPLDARVLLSRLARGYPDCFTFLCDGLVGATPELLVRRRGRAVESIVLAGSARREADADADAAVGAALAASDKDRREHDLAAASVRAGLAPRCDRLASDEAPWLLRLANVQHLATRFRGELAADGDGTVPTALDVAAALHPTAAVGGTPTAAAVTLIRELEGMDRGRYAGPVGWVDARGDGEMGIALRCAELSGARARLFAGSGIVGASLPEAELEETRLKLRAMQSAFADG